MRLLLKLLEERLIHTLQLRLIRASPTCTALASSPATSSTSARHTPVYVATRARHPPVHVTHLCASPPEHVIHLCTSHTCVRHSPVHAIHLCTSFICARYSPVHLIHLRTSHTCARHPPVHVIHLCTFLTCARHSPAPRHPLVCVTTHLCASLTCVTMGNSHSGEEAASSHQRMDDGVFTADMQVSGPQDNSKKNSSLNQLGISVSFQSLCDFCLLNSAYYIQLVWHRQQKEAECSVVI